MQIDTIRTRVAKVTSKLVKSGGIGKRMQLNIPKQFLLLAGKPIFIHVLEKIDVIKDITEIIIPCPSEFIEKTQEIINDYGFSKAIICIEGKTGIRIKRSIKSHVRKCNYS